MEYPTSVLPEIKLVVEIVRAGTVLERREEFAFAAWKAQGWLQSITLGAPDVAARAFSVAGLPTECSTEAQCLEVLESIAGSDDSRQRAFSIPPELLNGLLFWIMARVTEAIKKKRDA